QYNQIRGALGPRNYGFFGIVGMTPLDSASFKELRENLIINLKVAILPSYETELQQIAEIIANPSPFFGYTHGDPAPDNCLFVGDHLTWIDLEFGGFGAILMESLYWRMQCMNRLPASVLQAVEHAYQLGLASRLSAAKDEAFFGQAIVAAGIAWIWN